MTLTTTTLLFVATAVAEIVGCYLPLLWLKDRAPAWVLLPAAASLALFVWLLSLHPTAAGRVYAAYGGVYVAAAVVWLWLVDGVRPTAWDLTGSAWASSWLHRGPSVGATPNIALHRSRNSGAALAVAAR